MKTKVERRKPEGIKDYFALAFTTWGVGYLPIAPGTWGSAVAVAIYVAASYIISIILHSVGYFEEPIWPFLAQYPTSAIPQFWFAWIHTAVLISILAVTLIGIWSSGRSIELLGNSDPSEAVVDEVVGQLIVFLFVPFGLGWPFILVGFLLFRLFDIWKPYPIDDLQVLPGGLGICADDIVAGVYAGVCLAVIYAFSLSI